MNLLGKKRTITEEFRPTSIKGFPLDRGMDYTYDFEYQITSLVFKDSILYIDCMKDEVPYRFFVEGNWKKTGETME